MEKSTTKKYYKHDFKEVFNIDYLDNLSVFAKELLDHDIFTDKEYKSNVSLNDKLNSLYGQKIQDSYCNDLSIKWVNKFVEYGVFAENDISKNDMICEYTGVLRSDNIHDDSNLYVWDYPTFRYEYKDGKKRRSKIVYCVDAQKSGNYARFINHTQRRYQNVGVQMIMQGGLWHVIYVAKKNIKKGQQLLTFYGVEYWRDRKINPIAILP